METIIASAIAVLGTLLGSGLTLAFQHRTTDKGHQFTRHERLRQERLAGAFLQVIARPGIECSQLPKLRVQ
ncbi:hypothetical protein ACFV06_39360 [Streptomyces sp. NPDC059618]|uniref:hypothetical protein n=1 Tax=Streptomyces sp. NPDC059618 TaxID=3346887 RepID=UPI0036C80A61